MKLTKRGHYYSVEFRDADGKRKRISTGESDEAAAYSRAGAMVTQELARKPVGGPRGHLAEALESTYVSHWSRTRSSKVMRHVVDLLKRELAGINVTDVTTKLLRSHAERWLESGVAPATVNRRLSAVSVALVRCVEDGTLIHRPKVPHYAENNRKERYMTAAEEVAVMHFLATSTADDCVYMRHLFHFLIDTGFRFSEVFKFTLVDGHACLLHGTTKTNAGRRVPLTSRAMAAAQHLIESPVHARLKAMPSKAAWDFVSHRWQIVTKAAGCPDVTLHGLRHTLASRLVQRGVPIFTVSKWLGHSSVRVTERYAHLAGDSLASALVALEEDSNEAHGATA